MLIITLLVAKLSKVAYTTIASRSQNATYLSRRGFSIGPIMIESVILISWVLSFHFFNNNLLVLWTQLTTGRGQDILGGIENTLSKVNVQGVDFFVLLFKIYGTDIIFIAISLITGFVLIKRTTSGDNMVNVRDLFGLFCVFLSMGLLYALYLLGAPGFQAIGPTRIYFHLMMFTPILAGFALFWLMRNLRFRYFASVVVISLVMLAAGLGVFRLYVSPYTLRSNDQVTLMNMSGMTWFWENKDKRIGYTYIIAGPGTFAPGMTANVKAREWNIRTSGYYPNDDLPDHFGYREYDSLGESFASDWYALITSRDRIAYTTVWKIVGRFTADDFERLELDSNVDTLYSNGEMDTYFIHGIGGG